MKRKKLLLSVVLCFALLLTFIGCGNEQISDEEMFVGTWVNEEVPAYGKYVFSIEEEEFKVLGYLNLENQNPAGEGRPVIEEKWIDDAGNINFKVLINWSGVPYNEASSVLWYVLYRFNPEGDVLEFSASTVGYSEEIKVGERTWDRVHYRVQD